MSIDAGQHAPTRVAVIGAAGFVGSNVARAARDAGHDVLAIDRIAGGLPTMRVCDLMTDNLEWLASEPLAIWCAGSSDHRGSWDDPMRDLNANVAALLRALEHFSGRLVFVSSGAVYHGLRGPVGPSSALSPTFPYAISKLAAERYVEAFSEAGRIDDHVILRLFHPYGPGEPSRRIMAQLVERFGVRAETEMQLFGDGSTLMDVLPVSAVARMITAAATALVSHATLDICAGDPLTLRELAASVARAFGIDASIAGDLARAEDGIAFYGDPGPARIALGIGPAPPLSKTVREYAQWMVTNQPKLEGTVVANTSSTRSPE